MWCCTKLCLPDCVCLEMCLLLCMCCLVWYREAAEETEHSVSVCGVVCHSYFPLLREALSTDVCVHMLLEAIECLSQFHLPRCLFKAFSGEKSIQLKWINRPVQAVFNLCSFSCLLLRINSSFCAFLTIYGRVRETWLLFSGAFLHSKVMKIWSNT